MDILEALSLLEGLTVEQTLDKFVPQGISEDTIIEVIKNDPTSKYEGGKAGDYSQWILQKIKKGEKPTAELYKNLAIFDQAKRKKNFNGEKNIMAYKTIEEFNNSMEDSATEDKLEVELRTGIKPVFRGDKFTVFHPTTYEESKALRGDHAVWCTGKHDDQISWRQYSNLGELLILYDNEKNDAAYQAHITTQGIPEFRNARNNAVNMFNVLDKDPKVKDFVIDYQIEFRKTTDKPKKVIYVNRFHRLIFWDWPDNKPIMFLDFLPMKSSNFEYQVLDEDSYYDGLEYEDEEYSTYDGWEEVDEEAIDVFEAHDIAKALQGNQKIVEEYTVGELEQNSSFKMTYGKTGETLYVSNGRRGREIQVTWKKPMSAKEVMNEKEFIKGISLPDLFDARYLPDRFSFPCWWWLKEEVLQSKTEVLAVEPGQTINIEPTYVEDPNVGVRPVLICEEGRGDEVFQDYETIELFGKRWGYIGFDKLILLDEPLVKMAFNENEENGNNYGTSDVKKYLDKWLKEKINKN